MEEMKEFSKRKQLSKGYVQTKRNIPWKQIAFFIVAFTLVASGAGLWVVHSNDHNSWPSILSITFISVGIIVGLLQWLFPMSSIDVMYTPAQTYSTLQKTVPDIKIEKMEASSPMKQYEYDVAISYAGEDNNYADALADALQKRGVKVFYDRYEKSTLWGKNLYTYLSDLYQKKAHFSILFLSQHYASKLWTNHEREAAQARAFHEHNEYILPIRLDDTEIPGILPTVDYLRWPPENAETIADIIKAKITTI